MGHGAKEALSVWDALKPKIRQLIREETRNAVRKKKMNISSIDTTNHTVTVYEGANTTNTITIPYRSMNGIEDLTAGQSVIVEWICDDISTAVAATPGKGYAIISN